MGIAWDCLLFLLPHGTSIKADVIRETVSVTFISTALKGFKGCAYPISIL